MNKNCMKECKHNEYCRLDMVQTMQCKCSNAEVDEAFKEYTSTGNIFGYTTKEIAKKQGMGIEDLKQ